MEEAIRVFNEYAKTFDLSDPNLLLKYHHSHRVMEIAKEIAESLSLNENEVYIASLCGLLHDIGRFEQYTKYGTYKDSKSEDHGDLGFNILNDGLINKFDMDDLTKKIVLSATKEHNKMDYEPLNEQYDLFIKITRDADKLDIAKTQCITNNDSEIVLKDEVVNAIYNDELVNNLVCETGTDEILRTIAWINDLNFPYSYQYLLDNNIIDNKFHLLELYGEREDVTKLKDYVYKKFKEKAGK